MGVSSFGARSCQTTFSGGFCEAGVKNEATAVSEIILAKVQMGHGVMMESIRVVVDWTLRRNGGGDTGASSVLCLRFAGFVGDVIVRMIPRRRFLRIDARARFLGGCADGFRNRSFDRFKEVQYA